MARRRTSTTKQPALRPKGGAQPGAGEVAAAPTGASAGASEDGPRIVMALRCTYFPDGRVDEERYESDLAPSLVAAVYAARHLLVAVLDEAGGASEEDVIEVRRGEHVLRYGPGRDQVEIRRLAARPAHTDHTGASGPKVSPWLRAVTASRDADHASAVRAFEQEAAGAIAERAPQRAAVAYRSAAAAARATGRGDDANRLLRLAGKSYLEIAEGRDTPHQGVFLAYREAARCLLEAGNLPLAQASLGKAIAIGETLGYTDAPSRAG
jgi:hypothetical protein